MSYVVWIHNGMEYTRSDDLATLDEVLAYIANTAYTAYGREYEVMRRVDVQLIEKKPNPMGQGGTIAATGMMAPHLSDWAGG